MTDDQLAALAQLRNDLRGSPDGTLRADNRYLHDADVVIVCDACERQAQEIARLKMALERVQWATGAILSGDWPADDLRRAFVAGAAWWEWEARNATMWGSDRDKAEAEAERRYPGGIAAILAEPR